MKKAKGKKQDIEALVDEGLVGWISQYTRLEVDGEAHLELAALVKELVGQAGADMEGLIDDEILGWLHDHTRIEVDSRAHRELVRLVTGIVEAARGGT